MTRKELKKKVAEKLKLIRKNHNYDAEGIAEKLGVTRSTYNRNVSEVSLPDAFSLYWLGENLNISLDWLIREKGPMVFTEERPVKIVEKIVEKEVEKKEEKKEPPKPYALPPIMQDLEDDLKELFEAMQQSSQLRYDILAYFFKLKKEQD